LDPLGGEQILNFERLISMKAKRAKQEFEKLIRRSGERVGSLSPSRGLEMMMAFYRTVRFDDVDLAADGDMLLYQWGTYDWGEGESFEFDITRQLILGIGEDEDIFQLSLTFKFQPTVALRQLGAGNRWCHSLEEVEEFRSFIDSSPAIIAVRQATPSRVQLEYAVAG
jgi:hypothetical protein